MSVPANAVDPVLLHVETMRCISLALLQNDVPAVQAIRIVNGCAAPLVDVRVTVRTEPELSTDWTTRIARIESGASYDLREIDLRISAPALAKATERVGCDLVVEAAWQDGTATNRTSIALLAHDEWPGLSVLPEIAAAFVTPNHPAIATILRAASDQLDDWGGDASLSGYQSKDRRRIFLMAAAIYAALRGLGVTYVNPPASFEREGQRVRLPGAIAQYRLATCFDMALLAASALEACGLHPLVILVEGHAFTGVWLDDECFADSFVDDGLALRKRIELGEITAFDPTVATHASSNATFEFAVNEAQRRLREVSFVGAIDVRRARKAVPSRIVWK
jgi:hypothetical protein